jgi:hypothetical protein
VAARRVEPSRRDDATSAMSGLAAARWVTPFGTGITAPRPLGRELAAALPYRDSAIGCPPAEARARDATGTARSTLCTVRPSDGVRATVSRRWASRVDLGGAARGMVEKPAGAEARAVAGGGSQREPLVSTRFTAECLRPGLPRRLKSLDFLRAAGTARRACRAGRPRSRSRRFPASSGALLQISSPESATARHSTTGPRGSGTEGTDRAGRGPLLTRCRSTARTRGGGGGGGSGRPRWCASSRSRSR